MSRLQTGFLPGTAGGLHISLFLPGQMGVSSRWAIHVPAFGEEMNKSRHMVARQARELAAQGVTVVVPDLFGTGDSSGNLEQATWKIWREDVACLVNWARSERAAHLTLWGHRLGCLLAADTVQALSLSAEQLLFWQPVPSGKQHMAQFLRLKMAAGLARGGADTVSQLREKLIQGGSIEVAGYTITARLFGEIEAVVLAELAPPASMRVCMLEVVSEAGKPLLPVTAKLVEHWTQAGTDCLAATAQGDPFWMTQELGFAPELIEKTTPLLLPIQKESEVSSDLVEVVLDPENLSGNMVSSTSPEDVRTLVFNNGDEQLVGILHQARSGSSLGVLIVVGGPQYRVGSHRQFVHLARHLAGQGIPVLRFDYCGMGDSSGELRGFEHINSDIRTAIDAFQLVCPTATEVVIWGLCDAATSAAFYAGSDIRVKGLILANPWVYSERGAAKAYLKHYYSRRLLQPDFWSKVFSGGYSFVASMRSAWAMVKNVLIGNSSIEVGVAVPASESESSLSVAVSSQAPASNDLVSRFTEALAKFSGDVFFILSGKDLTAAEFIDAARGNRKLRRLMKRGNISQVTLPGVDHTFSCEAWRGEVEALSLEFISRIKANESN